MHRHEIPDGRSSHEVGGSNDIGLARLVGRQRALSGKDNTGLSPFMALDLLSDQALEGMVLRLCRHDIESFTRCLVYICICIKKDEDGQISTIGSLRYHRDLGTWIAVLFPQEVDTRVLLKVPVHRRSERPALVLYDRRIRQFHPRERAQSSAYPDSPRVTGDAPEYSPGDLRLFVESGCSATKKNTRNLRIANSLGKRRNFSLIITM